MKLRIRGNSLRLRVSKTELARIAESGKAEDTARFSSERMADEMQSRWEELVDAAP